MPVMAVKVCEAPECNRPAKNAGLCWAHRTRLRRHGSLDVTRRRLDGSAFATRTCQTCGSDFTKYQPPGTVLKYCSRECFRGQGNRPVSKACARCGTMFNAYPSEARRGRKYCSQECARVAPVARVTKACVTCGGLYEVRPRRAAKSRCCSFACNSVAHSREMIQRAIDQRTRLGRAQWRRVRDFVRARDGDKCTRCGMPGSMALLHVHHVIPWRISRDDSPENLVTLCAPCHRTVEAGIR